MKNTDEKSGRWSTGSLSGGVILGAVVANVVKLGIASINGMVVAAVCYLIGQGITKNK